MQEGDEVDIENLLSRIRDKYTQGVTAFDENRRLHSEDLNFVYNSETQGQWDPVVLDARKGKPSYTFNRVIGPVNIVVADMRQTKPNGKVRPTNDQANQATAEVLAGICRDVEDSSRADQIYKNQYKFAVAGGFGAWRLMPEWCSDDSFDQVLRIKDIPNPQTVIWDNESTDACAADAMWCMVAERISHDKYYTLFPNADAVSFTLSRDSYGWGTDQEVRIAEYFERVPFEKEIALLSDGSVVDHDDKAKEVDAHLEKHGMGEDRAARIKQVRKVLKWRVMWVKTDGGQILEGPIFYDWKRIPVIRVPGRFVNIEGRKKLQSLIRHAKDAQRSYNSRVSDMIERSALTPKAPYLVTESMVKGYEAEWSQANTASRPYLPYNVDKNAIDAGGMPMRTPPIDMPQAALALAQAAAQDIQATTGFFDPALGNAEDMNRVSGKALVQHTRRSDLGSFEFIDGFGDALQLTWEMMIDMIPTIYDTERVIRVIGQDEIEKLVKINGNGPDVIHDLKVGSYTCKVTIGPSWQTARQETLATLIDAAEAIPALAQIAPDLIAKNIDSPDADELARRLRIPLIHQGIIKPTEDEQKNMPPPPPPDPMQQAELQRMQALATRDHFGALLAQDKVNQIPLQTQKQQFETAGKHLSNLKTASDMGNDQAAAQAEMQADQAQSAQDLQQSQAEGQQNIQQNAMQHAQQMNQAATQHALDVGKQIHAHAHEMVRSQEKHTQEMAHTKEKNKANLEHAKELAKAKAKAAAKAPKKPKA